MRKRQSKKCQFPDCWAQARHTHHLTYAPSVVTRLCKAHHRSITIVNCNAAEKVKRKLTNRERLDLWSDWTEGLVKPVLTPQASAWVDNW